MICHQKFLRVKLAWIDCDKKYSPEYEDVKKLAKKTQRTYKEGV